MGEISLLVFAVFTVLTWRAFTQKIRRVEPLPEKIATCTAVALWSLWLMLIAAAFVFTHARDTFADSAAIVGWSLVAVANLAVFVRALLSRLALQRSYDREEKKEDRAPPPDL